MAETASHVTMLQRSLTYIVSVPAEERFANGIHRLLPERIAHWLLRWENVLIGTYFYRVCRSRSPERAKEWLRNRLARELPPGFDIDRHLTPTTRGTSASVSCPTPTCFAPSGPGGCRSSPTR